MLVLDPVYQSKLELVGFPSFSPQSFTLAFVHNVDDPDFLLLFPDDPLTEKIHSLSLVDLFRS